MTLMTTALLSCSMPPLGLHGRQILHALRKELSLMSSLKTSQIWLLPATPLSCCVCGCMLDATYKRSESIFFSASCCPWEPGWLDRCAITRRSQASFLQCVYLSVLWWIHWKGNSLALAIGICVIYKLIFSMVTCLTTWSWQLKSV